MGRPAKPWFRKQTGHWYVEINGKQEKLSRDRDEAYRLFHELMSRVHLAPESPSARVADVIEAFLAWSSTHCEPITYTNHRFYGEHLSDAIGMKAARDILPIHITRWIAKHGWSGWSEFGAKKSAKRFFSWAKKQGILRDNPLAEIENPTPPPRQRVLTDEEYRALLRGTSPPFRRFLFALRQTGARPKELRDLRWEQVRGDHLHLEKHKTGKKTKKPRIIYLTPTMQRAMAVWRAKFGSEHVFTNAHGEPWSANAIRMRMQRLRDRLGLDDDVVAYLARHAYGTSAILNGVDLATVSQLMGHSSTTITAAVYVHLESERGHLIGAAAKASRSGAGSRGGDA
jgi:integrase